MTQYILFELGRTAYALPSGAIQRLEMVEQVTPVPNALAFVDGVVFSRGKVVPAINLRARFGFEKVPYDLKTRLIVVAHEERAVGLIVDSAREFVSIPGEAVQAPPDSLGGTSGRYVGGIATVNGRVVLILDVAELLGRWGTESPTAQPT
jgi:purine-binding chemotaxis protein CheW